MCILSTKKKKIDKEMRLALKLADTKSRERSNWRLEYETSLII